MATCDGCGGSFIGEPWVDPEAAMILCDPCGRACAISPATETDDDEPVDPLAPPSSPEF